MHEQLWLSCPRPSCNDQKVRKGTPLGQVPGIHSRRSGSLHLLGTSPRRRTVRTENVTMLLGPYLPQSAEPSSSFSKRKKGNKTLLDICSLSSREFGRRVSKRENGRKSRGTGTDVTGADSRLLNQRHASSSSASSFSTQTKPSEKAQQLWVAADVAGVRTRPSSSSLSSVYGGVAGGGTGARRPPSSSFLEGLRLSGTRGRQAARRELQTEMDLEVELMIGRLGREAEEEEEEEREEGMESEMNSEGARGVLDLDHVDANPTQCTEGVEGQIERGGSEEFVFVTQSADASDFVSGAESESGYSDPTKKEHKQKQQRERGQKQQKRVKGKEEKDPFEDSRSVSPEPEPALSLCLQTTETQVETLAVGEFSAQRKATERRETRQEGDRHTVSQNKTTSRSNRLLIQTNDPNKNSGPHTQLNSPPVHRPIIPRLRIPPQLPAPSPKPPPGSHSTPLQDPHWLLLGRQGSIQQALTMTETERETVSSSADKARDPCRERETGKRPDWQEQREKEKGRLLCSPVLLQSQQKEKLAIDGKSAKSSSNRDSSKRQNQQKEIRQGQHPSQKVPLSLKGKLNTCLGGASAPSDKRPQRSRPATAGGARFRSGPQLSLSAAPNRPADLHSLRPLPDTTATPSPSPSHPHCSFLFQERISRLPLPTALPKEASPDSNYLQIAEDLWKTKGSKGSVSGLGHWDEKGSVQREVLQILGDSQESLQTPLDFSSVPSSDNAMGILVPSSDDVAGTAGVYPFSAEREESREGKEDSVSPSVASILHLVLQPG
uniref:Uncharacterized protein n=1 Tax=Chromera velia CCMP2878 TaxID=1169474 RepID=A0A0G4H5A6_9ALVE|eukprot:Cvel_24743.t1-p1 / transcript=Cvel_24743.t1 / gene=Cvel_24743 / organism=Chromera_velia_CCMP2878 / gene_product=hypothetical protein / transcript_product=hypothetical protein / location=Cvel_scaffold2717:20317-22644(+) / protein_length=776 / sequence_SO=supercontig / SO=protein_coding / is_pseudo=false